MTVRNCFLSFEGRYIFCVNFEDSNSKSSNSLMLNQHNPFIRSNQTLWSIALLLLRITVGGIIFNAGAGKVFGWFGGYGLEKTIEAFWTMNKIPAFWAYMSCFTELSGGFLMFIGLLTRPAAFAVMINMLVATIVVGLDKFWTGGGTFPFTLAIGSLVILLVGPGAYSLDAILFSRKSGTKR